MSIFIEIAGKKQSTNLIHLWKLPSNFKQKNSMEKDEKQK